MLVKKDKLFKALVLLNGIISFVITIKIFNKNNYDLENISVGFVILTFYAIIWYYSLYKIYNFSKFGIKLYIILTVLGFIFNILSNFSFLDKPLYILNLSEHMIIGSILTFSFFSNLKSRFK